MNLLNVCALIRVPVGYCTSTTRRRFLKQISSGLTALVLLGVAPSAQTPTCSCPTDTSPLYENYGGDGAPETATPILRSDIVLDLRGKDGKLRTSHIVIESNASFNGKEGFLRYKIFNNGAAVVGVLLNIQLTPAIYAQLTVAETPYFLKPKEAIEFKATLLEQPEFAPSTVVFYNEKGDRAALETVGFYGSPSGTIKLNNNTLWRRAN